MAQEQSLSLAGKFRAFLLGSAGSKLDYMCATLESLARDHYRIEDESYSTKIMQQSAQDEPEFYGAGITTKDDIKRVRGGLKRVYMYMRGGRWHTLGRISAETGVPEASVSAGLRSLRREKYGSHTIDRKHMGNGLHVYRFVPNHAHIAELEAHLKINPTHVPIERIGDEPKDEELNFDNLF